MYTYIHIKQQKLIRILNYLTTKYLQLKNTAIAFTACAKSLSMVKVKDLLLIINRVSDDTNYLQQNYPNKDRQIGCFYIRGRQTLLYSQDKCQ